MHVFSASIPPVSLIRILFKDSNRATSATFSASYNRGVEMYPQMYPLQSVATPSPTTADRLRKRSTSRTAPELPFDLYVSSSSIRGIAEYGRRCTSESIPDHSDNPSPLLYLRHRMHSATRLTLGSPTGHETIRDPTSLGHPVIPPCTSLGDHPREAAILSFGLGKHLRHQPSRQPYRRVNCATHEHTVALCQDTVSMSVRPSTFGQM